MPDFLVALCLSVSQVVLIMLMYIFCYVNTRAVLKFQISCMHATC